MKKLVSIILMLAIMSVCIVPVFAEDEQDIAPAYVVISDIKCLGSVSGGVMTYTASGTFVNSSYANVRMVLQKAPAGTTNFSYDSTLANQNVTGDLDGIEGFSITKTAIKKSGYDYRVEFTLRVYNTHDVCIDSGTTYSPVL
ncbi:MAG: hypothetical protein IJM98_09190 [Oscillospiraceae bacterium]|nr:hypothetical protein [Oscillospiraceae bacterium]